MLMGAFTVGLWVWLLEPGGYRQKHPVADNEEVDGAYFSKEDFDHSLKSSPSLFEEDEKDRSTENRSIRSLQATLAVPEANEKSSAPVLHKQPASKPSAYDSGDVLWSGRRLHVEAWAILPQAANHLPPPDLMTEFWSRAVVTQYGGVVLLGSGHFATWDFETPGKVRTAADSGRHFKACFDTFGSSGSRYPAPCLGDQRQEPSCASADTRWLWRSVLLRQGRRSTRQPPERRTNDPESRTSEASPPDLVTTWSRCDECGADRRWLGLGDLKGPLETGSGSGFMGKDLRRRRQPECHG